MNAVELGKHLRMLRKERGLTLVELSVTSGVSNPYISQIENGKFKPTPDILKKLSNGLDIPYFELMEAAGYWENEEDFAFLKNELKSLRERQDFLFKILKEFEKENLDMSIENSAERTRLFMEAVNKDEKMKLITKEQRKIDDQIQNIEWQLEQVRLNKHKTHNKFEEEKDIAKNLINLKRKLTIFDDLNFEGEPISKESKDTLIELIEFTFKQIQVINKYTQTKHNKV